jgi:NADH-quinone oxidoreductase subunit J
MALLTVLFALGIIFNRNTILRVLCLIFALICATTFYFMFTTENRIVFDMFDIAFIILALTTLTAAVGVVLLRNIVHSALCLILTFLCVAGFYFQLNAEFVALIQIMVYAGAISILIIFAVMLVMDRDPSRTSLPAVGTNKSLVAGYGIFLTVACLGLAGLQTEWPEAPAPPGDSMRALAHLYLGDYIIVFLGAAVLLLVAVVGAITLAKGKGADDK